MAVAWFLVPYRVDLGDGNVGDARRYPATDDFRDQLDAVATVEILGGYALAKVRGPIVALQALNAEPGVVHIPKAALDDSLADLTNAQKVAIRDRLLALGYTSAQLQAALGGDIGSRTLRELLRFAASRWRRPVTLDPATGDVVYEAEDWPGGPPKPIEVVDVAVADA